MKYTFVILMPTLILAVAIFTSGASAAQTYQLTDLGAVIGTNSYAQGINNQGQVVGYWYAADGAHAYLYQSGTVTDLGLLGASETNNYALSINNVGQVVGFSETTNGSRAFLFQNGVVTNLGSLGGLGSYAYGINGGGQIVGYVATPKGSRAYLFDSGNLTDLGTLGGTNSLAFGINNFLQVAGFSFLPDNTTAHAFLWQNGVMNDLNQIQAYNSGWQLAVAHGINDWGNIVGWGVINNQEHGFSFSSSGAATDLGVLAGGTNSYALGINNSNQIVGASSSSVGKHAVVWQNGFTYDLNSLINASGWELIEASGINDLGQIVGWGAVNGLGHAFLLTPVAASPKSTPLAAKVTPVLLTSGNIKSKSGGNATIIKPLFSPPIPPPTLQLQMPFTNSATQDPSTTSAASYTNGGGINITMNMFSNGVATFNLHGTTLDMTTNTCPTQGTNQPVSISSGVNTEAAAIVDLLNNTTLTNLGSGNGNITNFTVTMWFNEQLVCNQALVGPRLWVLNAGASGTDINGSANSMGMKFQASNQLYFDMGTADGLLSGMLPGSVDFPANQWIFIAVTYDGTTFNMYYGTPTNSVTLIGTTTSANQSISLGSAACLAIGNRATDYFRGFNGKIQDFRIYNGGGSSAFVDGVRSQLSSLAVTITNPVNNASFILPTNITINASTIDSIGTVTQVQFFVGSKLLGTDTSAPYNVIWTNATVGLHALTAIAMDDAGLTATSSIVNIILGTNLPPVADAFVRQGAANVNVNFGTTNILECEKSGTSANNRDTYFKFDLGTLNGVTNVQLRVFAALSGAGATSNTIYSVADSSWVETNITWNNAPALGTPLITNSMTGTAGSWYLSDVTTYVNSQTAVGSNLVTLVMHDQNNTALLITANSRENSTNQPSLVIMATNAPFNVSITSPINGTTIMGTTNVTASAIDNDGTVTQVQFFQGTTSLGIDTNAPYSVVWSNPPVGSQTLTAIATDNGGLMVTSSVINVTVDAPPAVTLTNPANGSLIVAGSNISLGASAADVDGTVAQVQFFQGTNSLGIDTSAPYSLTWSNVASGTYALTACATDNNGLITTSSVVNIVVEIPPTVSITSPTNGSVIAVPTNLTINATAADSDGTVAQVQFFVGAKLLGVITSSPFNFTWNNAPPGLYALTAVAVDNLGLMTTSSVVAVTLDSSLLPTADAHVRDGSFTNTNFGTNTIMEVQTAAGTGTNRDDYFKFDLSNVNANISSAKLNIYALVSTNAPVTNIVYSVTNTGWGEATITWSNKPARITALTTNTLSGTNGVWYSYDVTSFVKAQQAAGQNLISMALHDPTNITRLVSINSKENSTNNPALVIITTNTPPSVSITSPTNNAVFTASANITINASASDNGGISQVRFFQGSVYLGVATNFPYSMTWSNVATNNYALTAIAVDNYGMTSTSGVVNVKVISLYASNNISLWFKGDAITGLTNNAPISTWPDSSGWANNATQVTSANQPRYETNILNGHPIIRFNGTNSYFNLTNVFKGIAGAETFVVLKAATNAPSRTASLWRMGSEYPNPGIGYPNPSGQIVEDFGFGAAGNIGNNLGVPSQPLTQYNVYEVSAKTGNWAAWLNGILLYQRTDDTYGTNSTPWLGGDLVWGNYFGGDIAEVLIFSRTLTASERLTVNSYLNGKYALVPSIPATPTNLVATAISTTQIGLTWDAVLNGGATQIAIERSVTSNGVYQTVTQISGANSYVDASLTPGTTYYYQVQAVNLTQLSTASNVAHASTLLTGADVPFNSLLMWLKADAGLVQGGTNTPVDLWADQSVSGNNAMQPTGGIQPLWVPGVIGDRPVVRFNGTNTYFNLANILNGTTGAEVVMVLKAATNTPSRTASLWRMGNEYPNPGLGYPNNIGQIVEDFGFGAGNIGNNFGVPSQPLTQYNVYEVSAGVGNWLAWLNGNLLFQTNNNTYAYFTPLWLGGDLVWGNYFGGDIAEMMVFNRTLTVDERDAAGKYLVAKYNLSQFATNSTPPAAPTNFVATGITPYQINLQWTLASNNASSFIIESKLGTNGTFQEIGSVLGNIFSFLNTAYSATNQYFFRVKARNVFGDSAYSAVISPPMASITNPPAQSVYSTGTNITVNVAASDLDGTVAQVNFWVNGALYLTTTNVPYSGILTNLGAGVISMMVQPVDNQGNSSFSTVVNLIVSPDTDGDGINDFQEILMGTDPTNPLDPGPWTPPTTSTAPTINLIEPVNAVLLP